MPYGTSSLTDQPSLRDASHGYEAHAAESQLGSAGKPEYHNSKMRPQNGYGILK